MGACSRSLYALRVLRVHGLPPAVLHKVSRARLPYAWWGFAKQKDRNRLERLLKRMRRMGYLPSSTPDVADLVRAAEDRLLGAVVANSLLPVFPKPLSSFMTSPCHSEMTVILFPECCIGPCNRNILITLS